MWHHFGGFRLGNLLRAGRNEPVVAGTRQRIPEGNAGREFHFLDVPFDLGKCTQAVRQVIMRQQVDSLRLPFVCTYIYRVCDSSSSLLNAMVSTILNIPINML